MKKYVVICDAYAEVMASSEKQALKKAMDSESGDWELSNYNIEEDL